MSWLSDLLDAIERLFGGGRDEPPPRPTGARVNIRVRESGGGNVSVGGALVTISVRGEELTRGTDAGGWVHFEDVDVGPRHLWVAKKGFNDHNEHFEVVLPETNKTVAIREKGAQSSPGPDPSPRPRPPMTSDKVIALRRVAAAYLDEYEHAHVGRIGGQHQPKQEAFIRRAAACLRYGSEVLGIRGDGKTMLLGQYGGDVISQDAVLYEGQYHDVIISAGTQRRDLNKLTWPGEHGPQGNAKAIQPDRDLVPKASAPSGRRRRSGIVLVDGKWLADAGGRWYVLNHTFFPAIHLVLQDKPLYIDTCQYLFELGVDVIRILCTTGSPKADYWDGRDWDSRSPKFPGWLELAIDVAWNNGIRTQPTIFGSQGYHESDDDKFRFVDTVVPVLNGDREKIGFIEAVNEYEHGSILNKNTRLLRALGRRIMDQTDIPTALSTPLRSIENGTEIYKDSGAQIATIHTWRSGTTGIRREDVRRIQGLPPVWADNEPRGPGASAGGDVRDPATLANDLKTSAAHGGNVYCFHTDSSVWFGLHGSKRRIWEEPGADACLKAVSKARDGVKVG